MNGPRTTPAERPWKPDVLVREADIVGDPPVWNLQTNAEFAAPGTAAWCRKARRLIKRMAAELKEPSGV